MTTQAFPYLVITDGTTTATIADGSGGATSYMLSNDNWAPAVAEISDSQLGGRGPYEDVTETLVLNITGASPAAAYANAQALHRLIEQAERWSRGENVAVVLMKYAPQGSTVASTAAPYQAVVTGLPAKTGAWGTNAPNTTLPADFVRSGMTSYLEGMTFVFTRRGAWLLGATVDGSSAATTNPGPFPITGMTTHPNTSPAKLKLAGFTSSTTLDFADSAPILLLAQQGSDLVVAEAEGGTASKYTSVVDTTDISRGGHVLRYTPTNTSEIGSGYIQMTPTSGARRLAFFAAIRNNSATTTWNIRVAAYVAVKTSIDVEAQSVTPYVTIDAAHTRPRFLPLGIATISADLAGIRFLITASAAADTLDIDYVVALAVDNPYARAIQLTSGIFDLPASMGTWDLFVDPGPLTAIAPSIYRKDQSASLNEPVGYYGDAFVLANGTTFQALLMGKRADGSNNQCWTYGPASGAAITLTLTASRYNAYLVPE